MIIRCRPLVNILCPLIFPVALSACGNNGAPPYAPETQGVASKAPLAAAAATAAAASPVAAAAPSDPKVLYDLREKCGADARQWYQHFYEESGVYPKQSTVSHGFTSHYDSKTNACFAVTSSISSIKELKSRRAQIVEVQKLADVLENRDIGTFFYQADSATPAECHVADKACNSREEWQSLSAPYMND